MHDYNEQLKSAVSAGPAGIRAFLDASLRSDSGALLRWAGGDEIPLHLFLPLAAALHDGGQEALLSPSRQLITEEYVYLRDRVAGSAPAMGPPRSPPPSLLEFENAARVAPQLSAEATRFVLQSVKPAEIRDGAPRLLVMQKLAAAAARPELYPLVADLIRQGLLSEIDPVQMTTWYRQQMVPLLAVALRRHPVFPQPICDLARSLRGQPGDGPCDAGLAAELEHWWLDEGPYLILDAGALPPFPGLKPWLVVDDYAQFTGTTWHVPAADDPGSVAWKALPQPERARLATESASQRKANAAGFSGWYQEKRRELHLP